LGARRDQGRHGDRGRNKPTPGELSRNQETPRKNGAKRSIRPRERAQTPRTANRGHNQRGTISTTGRGKGESVWGAHKQTRQEHDCAPVREGSR